MNRYPQTTSSGDALPLSEPARALAELGDCVLCDAARNAEREYLARLGIPARRASHAEAIADAFGYCAAHARQLGSRSSPELRALFGRAAQLLGEWLEHDASKDDRLRGALFDAANSCPACAFREQRIARRIGALQSRRSEAAIEAAGRALCAPHYRTLVSVSPASWLSTLARGQIARTHALDEALRHAVSNDALLTETVLRACAGLPTGETDQGTGLRERVDCHVCLATAHALFHWTHGVRDGARLGVEVITAYPTCGAHLWICARLGDARLARRIVRHAVDELAHMLQGGLAAIVADEKRLQREARSVWYRRKSPSYLLGLRRKAVTRVRRCPACECRDVACDRAVGELLDRLREPSHRAALERGLCAKHFARAYIVATKGPVREALLAVQLRELAALANGTALSHDAVRRFSPLV